MLVDDAGTVLWIGGDEAGRGLGADREEPLDGALVTPGFVDAHVHSTAAGLALGGLDLHLTSSLTEALDQVATYARAHPGEVLLGTGWDDTRWEHGRPPTAEEIDRATDGAVVYLARADVHSAVASSALLARCPEAAALPGFEPDGLVRWDAHHVVRQAAFSAMGADQRREAQRRTLRHAASLGVVALHEMAGPEVSSADDLQELLSLARAEPGPLVTGYWGELDGVATARELGAHGVGGDLFVDGAVGSHTACFHEPYADDTTTPGLLRYDAAQVAHHVVACAAAGMQTGFHVIGDAAVDVVLRGFAAAAEKVGVPAVVAGRHRLEHAECLDAAQIAQMAALGLVASVQPAFDAFWGGPDGMYVQRLGAGRAARMNPFAALTAAGVSLAFSSDAPVTPVDPWGGVRAAVHHRTPGQGISARAAFNAHTRGGWRAAGIDDQGVLAPGMPATYAVWDCGELVVQQPDSRVAQWSTDPRAGVSGLPDLQPDGPLPRCLRTVIAGRVVHAVAAATNA